MTDSKTRPKWLVSTLPNFNSGRISCVTIKDDRLYLGGWNYQVYVINLSGEDRDYPLVKVGSTNGKVYAIDSTADLVAFVAQDGTCTVINRATGNIIKRIVLNSSWVMSTALSSDQKSVFTGGLDNTVTHYQIDPPVVLGTCEHHNGYVANLCPSSDGDFIYSASGDASIAQMDVKTHATKTYHHHKSDVMSLVLAGDDKRLFSCGCDNLAFEVDTVTAQCIRIYAGGDADLNAIVLSHDERFVYAGSDGGYVYEWATSTHGNDKPDTLTVQPNGTMQVSPNRVFRLAEGPASTAVTITSLATSEYLLAVGHECGLSIVNVADEPELYDAKTLIPILSDPSQYRLPDTVAEIVWSYLETKGHPHLDDLAHYLDKLNANESVGMSSIGQKSIE